MQQTLLTVAENLWKSQQSGRDGSGPARRQRAKNRNAVTVF